MLEQEKQTAELLTSKLRLLDLRIESLRKTLTTKHDFMLQNVYAFGIKQLYDMRFNWLEALETFKRNEVMKDPTDVDKMQLRPHEQRVVEECEDLQGKVTRLATFLEGDLSKEIKPPDRHLLERQLEYMQDYLRILKMRIAGFTV